MIGSSDVRIGRRGTPVVNTKLFQRQWRKDSHILQPFYSSEARRSENFTGQVNKQIDLLSQA
jgi:hypothetical protein